MGTLLKYRTWFTGLVRDWALAFLSSQVRLVLLSFGPHFDSKALAPHRSYSLGAGFPPTVSKLHLCRLGAAHQPVGSWVAKLRALMLGSQELTRESV